MDSHVAYHYHNLAQDLCLRRVQILCSHCVKIHTRHVPTTDSQHARTARGARTRAAVFTAARAILENEGFESLSMAAVADRAGISRRALYNHFTSRADLVAALFDHIAEAEGLARSVRPAIDAPNAETALDEWAQHLARYHPRLLAIDRAIARVRKVDQDAAQHWERVKREKYANCRILVERIARDGRLASSWTLASAADMLYALISSDLVEALLYDRRWSAERFARQLAVLLRSTFLQEPGATVQRRRVRRR
ncbi:MAG: TetR/AcrR family transcriptional regulator [Gemmatimonadaceae bacterium]